MITICQIPAPSNHEEKRAAFCKEWLEKQGAKNVTIDKALNVVYPINCEGSDEIVAVMAHSDTVFPDMEPMPLRIEDGKIFSPGIGDDTANVAIMLMIVKFILENRLIPKGAVMFVVDAGEEGLGNLKGCRQIMEDYAGRIKEVLALDGYFLPRWLPARWDLCAIGWKYSRKAATPTAISVTETPSTCWRP